MTTQPSIGFIGFGEAGSHIASGLRSAGIQQLKAFDINASSPDSGPRIQQRATDSQTTLVASSSELAASTDILFSAVTATSALDGSRGPPF